eukprot:gnl/Chilomastix_cuspidata/2256.p1 GENE.gnl/Chilomastix_cuspidata/2256~~gnl/Chilomastix_cuspidata/2256.p1  ORF type:complete len:443 (+),score=156.45 gnl/Chilomastix_cuspidata/2256:1603-2931(+)
MIQKLMCERVRTIVTRMRGVSKHSEFESMNRAALRLEESEKSSSTPVLVLESNSSGSSSPPPSPSISSLQNALAPHAQPLHPERRLPRFLVRALEWVRKNLRLLFFLLLSTVLLLITILGWIAAANSEGPPAFAYTTADFVPDVYVIDLWDPTGAESDEAAAALERAAFEVLEGDGFTFAAPTAVSELTALDAASSGVPISVETTFYMCDPATGALYAAQARHGAVTRTERLFTFPGGGAPFPCAWETIQDGKLVVGAAGFAENGVAGATPFQVFFVQHADDSELIGAVSRLDWSDFYAQMREALGAATGFVAVGAVVWRADEGQWVVAANRVSAEPYNEAVFNSSGSRAFLVASEDFSTIVVKKFDLRSVATRGTVGLRELPGRNGTFVGLRLDTEVVGSNTTLRELFLFVSDIEGTTVLPETSLGTFEPSQAYQLAQILV